MLKLRDDSFALQPWLIPSSWAQMGLTSLHCMQWGGVMDSTFAVGRRWAWAIMEGLAADWYISHYALTEAGLAIPHNPESWIAGLAKLKHVPVQTKGLCELPFLSVRFVNRGSSCCLWHVCETGGIGRVLFGVVRIRTMQGAQMSARRSWVLEQQGR